ncbi:collectin-12-like [Mytilus trossulus]|uniref:collectin-12-like n=1 Tax=Mytilus trossulus TaxID=6551 RepID=UPI00300714FE
MDVQGNIESVITVDTYLECARYCIQSDVCDGIFYNSTNGYCVIIAIADGLISNVSLGTFFRLKKIQQGLRFWWIGGTDAAQEGIFRWINGENVTYSNWAQGQPDDWSEGIHGADCIRYVINSKTEAVWVDKHCHDELRSICENKMFL